MEGFIRGAIVGLTAALLGPAVVTGVGKVFAPLGEKIVETSAAAMGMVSGLVSDLGRGVWGTSETGKESDQKTPPEQGGVIPKIEEIGKDIAIDLAEEEAATFIKMVLLAAL